MKSMGKKTLGVLDAPNKQLLIQGKLDWNSILLTDLNYILQLAQQSPLDYQLDDVNVFLKDIKKILKQKIGHSEYQYITRIFAHKFNDDHTSIYFNQDEFIYSGFTATFQLDPEITIQQTPQRHTELIQQLNKGHIVSKQKNQNRENNQMRIAYQNEINKNKSKITSEVSGKTKSRSNDRRESQQYEGQQPRSASRLSQSVNVVTNYTDIIKKYKLLVDVVNGPFVLDKLQRGDEIVLINKKPAIEYLEKVAKYCQRNTNVLTYNMHKQAITLGIMNYLFPVTTITIKRNSKTILVGLSYYKIDYNLNFVMNDKQKEHISFRDYMYYSRGKANIHQNASFIQVQDDLACMFYPLFNLQIPKFYKDIEQYMKDNRFNTKNQQNINPTIKGKRTIVVDLRGNGGGSHTAGLQLVALLIQKGLPDVLTDHTMTTSITYQFEQQLVNKMIVNILNDKSANINQKLKDIQQANQRLRYHYNLAKKNPLYIIDQEVPQIDIESVIRKQGQYYINNQMPGIVIITNYRCSSSCSLFVANMKIFPQVILIGSEVQTYNGSAGPVDFELPSKQGLVVIPSWKANTGLDQLYLKTRQANVYTHPRNIPQNPENFEKWASTNKPYFDSLILEQCKQYNNQS